MCTIPGTTQGHVVEWPEVGVSSRFLVTEIKSRARDRRHEFIKSRSEKTGAPACLRGEPPTPGWRGWVGFIVALMCPPCLRATEADRLAYLAWAARHMLHWEGGSWKTAWLMTYPESLKHEARGPISRCAARCSCTALHGGRYAGVWPRRPCRPDVPITRLPGPRGRLRPAGLAGALWYAGVLYGRVDLVPFFYAAPPNTEAFWQRGVDPRIRKNGE